MLTYKRLTILAVFMTTLNAFWWSSEPEPTPEQVEDEMDEPEIRARQLYKSLQDKLHFEAWFDWAMLETHYREERLKCFWVHVMPHFKKWRDSDPQPWADPNDATLYRNAC